MGIHNVNRFTNQPTVSPPNDAGDLKFPGKEPILETKMQELKERLATISDLRSAYALMSWDQDTYMPAQGAAGRARQMSTVSRLAHEHFVDDATGKLIDELEPWAVDQPYDSDEAALLRRLRRDYDREIKVPSEFVARSSEARALASSVWPKAKEANDFALFLPHLQKNFEGIGPNPQSPIPNPQSPIFGLLADRVKGRWLAAVGLMWTMIFFAAASFATTYVGLLSMLVIGALGSGAFHPVGAMSATHAGGAKGTSATSIFFLFGQSGLALGPVVSGAVLQRYGLAGLPWVALAMLPAVAMMVAFLRQPIPTGQDSGQNSAPRPQAHPSPNSGWTSGGWPWRPSSP